MRLLAVGAALASLVGTGAGAAAPEQSTPKRDMLLRSQTYGVRDGSMAAFDFELTIDIAELTDPGTSATTTTSNPIGSGRPNGPVEATPDAPTLEIHVSSFDRVSNRADVEAAIVGGFGAATDTYVTPLLPAASVGDDDIIGLTFEVPISGDEVDDARLDLIEPGIYPVTISLLRDGDVFAQHITFIERVRDNPVGLGPVTLAVLAAVEQPPPNATEADLLRVRPQLTEVAAIADTIAAPITVRIPASVTADVLAPDANLRERTTSALVGDVLIAGPLVDIDPDAAAAAEIDEDYQRLNDRASQMLSEMFPESTVDESIFLVQHPLTATGVDLLDRTGYRLLVVDDPTLAELTPQAIEIAPIDSSLLLSAGNDTEHELGAVIIDTAMELLDPERGTNSTAAADAINLMAIISSLRQDAAPALRSLVLATPDIGIPDADVLEHLERYVAEHPDFELGLVGDLPSRTNSNFVDGEVLSFDWPRVIDGRLLVRELIIDDARSDIESALSMLSEFDPRRSRWHEQLDAAIATQLSDTEAAEMINDTRAEADSVLGAVPPPEPFAFTLTGSDSELRLRLTNDDSQPLDVVVHLESDRLNADDAEVLLAPDSITEVAIELDVRSNGRTPVMLEVRAPDGTPLFEPVELSARVNTLTGLGRVVSVGALLVLLSWWFHYLRRRHRQRTTGAPALG